MNDDEPQGHSPLLFLGILMVILLTTFGILYYFNTSHPHL
jgi:hypothetical protein